MKLKTTLQTTAAGILFALVAATPVQATETQWSTWLSNLLGQLQPNAEDPGAKTAKYQTPEHNKGPVYVPQGGGLGGGDPGIDPE